MAAPVNSYAPGPWKPKNAWDVLNRLMPQIMDGGGNWTPYNAAATLFDEIEFRTTVTPPIVYKTKNLEDPTPNPVMQKLRPAIILRGPLGTKVISPYGEVPDGTENAWKLVAGVIGGVVALGAAGFVMGRVRERVKTRRRAARGG